jgi:hypothetical protein
MNAQQTQINNLSVQVNIAINKADSAIGSAKSATDLANALKGQLATLNGDVKQLQANDHSFSALLKQWWGALESWRGGHFLVNQGMSGNAHTRFDPLLLDVNGDGFKFTGQTKTNLLTGEAQNVRWLEKGDPDAFMLVDATSLRAAGYDIQNARGESVDGLTLFRDGLRIKDPSGNEKIVGSGWELLAAFDANKDGKINSSDPVWQHLKLWADSDADGAINEKLQGLSDAGVRDVNLGGLKAQTVDSLGNTREDGTFTWADGRTGTATDVNFAAIQ